MEWTLWSTSY